MTKKSINLIQHENIPIPVIDIKYIIYNRSIKFLLNFILNFIFITSFVIYNPTISINHLLIIFYISVYKKYNNFYYIFSTILKVYK